MHNSYAVTCGWRRRLMALAILGSAALPAMGDPVRINLTFVGTPDSAAHQGAVQGLEEAQIQGDFLGQRYAMNVVSSTAPMSNVIAIIAAMPADTLLQLSARHPSIPILNVTDESDSLRAVCHPNLVHVIASSGMRTQATTQWQQANPNATNVQAQAWHPAFEKYAAAQLNKRFEERYRQPMNDQAWSGWAAVKLLSDMIARTQTTDSSEVMTAIREQLAFDGQKGIDLSFAANGQLRQPLLLVAADKLIGEAPVRGVADIEDLDSLITTECAK